MGTDKVKRERFRYVTHNGGIWRMSPSKFAELKRIVKAQVEPFDLDNFGTMITANVLTVEDLQHDD
jgi:hypothetical protein